MFADLVFVFENFGRSRVFAIFLADLVFSEKDVADLVFFFTSRVRKKIIVESFVFLGNPIADLVFS